MRPKKHPEKDLNSKRLVYFVLGILIILALIYIALEWKTTYDNNGYDISRIPNNESNENSGSLTITTRTKNNNASEAKDTILNMENELIEIPFCPVDDLDEEIITFHIVQKAPIFPGCENEPDKKKCFIKMIQQHVMKNFRYPETTENINPYFKIYIQFIIKKDGTIGSIKASGPSKNLKLAAKQTIEKLPKMTPAKHNGKVTDLSFVFPISIHMQD